MPTESGIKNLRWSCSVCGLKPAGASKLILKEGLTNICRCPNCGCARVCKCEEVEAKAPKAKSKSARHITNVQLDRRLTKLTKKRGLIGTMKSGDEKQCRSLFHKINRLSERMERIGLMGLRELDEGSRF